MNADDLILSLDADLKKAKERVARQDRALMHFGEARWYWLHDKAISYEVVARLVRGFDELDGLVAESYE